MNRKKKMAHIRIYDKRMQIWPSNSEQQTLVVLACAASRAVLRHRHTCDTIPLTWHRQHHAAFQLSIIIGDKSIQFWSKYLFFFRSFDFAWNTNINYLTVSGYCLDKQEGRPKKRDKRALFLFFSFFFLPILFARFFSFSSVTFIFCLFVHIAGYWRTARS